jgi:hypothetical protein
MSMRFLVIGDRSPTPTFTREAEGHKVGLHANASLSAPVKPTEGCGQGVLVKAARIAEAVRGQTGKVGRTVPSCEDVWPFRPQVR